jgi:acetyl esterase/lipase
MFHYATKVNDRDEVEICIRALQSHRIKVDYVVFERVHHGFRVLFGANATIETIREAILSGNIVYEYEQFIRKLCIVI